MTRHLRYARALPAGAILAALSLGACTELDAALRVMETTGETAPAATSKRAQQPRSSVTIVQEDEHGQMVVTRNESREAGTRTIRRTTGNNAIVIRQTQR